MRVKHFRLDTDTKRYYLALLPIDFRRLLDDKAVETAIATEGFFLLAIDDDSYVEADPYGWLEKDWDLFCAHFYLRERAKTLRGGQVLYASEIRDAVEDVARKLVSERDGAAPDASEQDAPAEDEADASASASPPVSGAIR